MSLSLNSIDVFITDWDETVTAEDTMSVLSLAAYNHKEEFHPPWSFFGEMYYKDYEDYSCKFPRRASIEEEAEFLKGLKQVELDSVDRVEKSGLFKNVPESTVRSQANKVKIRNGWWEILRKLVENNIPIIILSVNWSDILIEEVLSLNGFNKGSNNITIYANKIKIDDNGLATGELEGHPILSHGIRTAQDKLEVIKQIREKKLSGKDDPERIAYFGDSSTDTLALLEADFGVIIHKQSLVDRLEGLGVKILKKDDRKDNENEVYYLKEWSDLLDM